VLDRLFDCVFVRTPSNSYARCVSSHPQRDSIDVTLAKEQHREYVSIIREAGIKVLELPPLEEFPDSVFACDSALLGKRTCVIGRFGEKTRRGEEEALVKELGHFGNVVGELKYVLAPGTLEGGDVLVTEQGVFVGESTRTNAEGIRQLSEHMRNMKVRSIKSDTFHMLCGCSYLSEGSMLIVPELLNPNSFPGFRFVSLPEEESYASEVLYLGQGRVLIPAGYPKATTKLKEAGYRPVEVELSEFNKGDGGVSCLSQPVHNIL